MCSDDSCSAEFASDDAEMSEAELAEFEAAEADDTTLMGHQPDSDPESDKNLCACFLFLMLSATPAPPPKRRGSRFANGAWKEEQKNEWIGRRSRALKPFEKCCDEIKSFVFDHIDMSADKYRKFFAKTTSGEISNAIIINNPGRLHEMADLLTQDYPNLMTGRCFTMLLVPVTSIDSPSATTPGKLGPGSAPAPRTLISRNFSISTDLALIRHWRQWSHEFGHQAGLTHSQDNHVYFNHSKGAYDPNEVPAQFKRAEDDLARPRAISSTGTDFRQQDCDVIREYIRANIKCSPSTPKADLFAF